MCFTVAMVSQFSKYFSERCVFCKYVGSVCHLRRLSSNGVTSIGHASYIALQADGLAIKHIIDVFNEIRLRTDMQVVLSL